MYGSCGEERPVKRHKGCIKYYLQDSKENTGQASQFESLLMSYVTIVRCK